MTIQQMISPTGQVNKDFLNAFSVPNDSQSAFDVVKAMEKANDDYAYMGSEDLAELISGQALANRDFEIAQAQKQMDYQTNANAIAMEFSASEAQKARDWEEYMSNSSWQRAVEDMKAAGLNPVLAYAQGGASTPTSPSPSGVSSSGSKADLSDLGYDYAKLLLDLYKNESSHSNSTLNTIINCVFGLGKAAMSAGGG